MTYIPKQLTASVWVLPFRITIAHFVKQFPHLSIDRSIDRFFTRTRHLLVVWAKEIQFYKIHSNIFLYVTSKSSVRLSFWFCYQNCVFICCPLSPTFPACIVILMWNHEYVKKRETPEAPNYAPFPISCCCFLRYSLQSLPSLSSYEHLNSMLWP